MSRPITEKDKRTIRFAAIGVLVYLALFYGPAARNYLVAKREAYNALVQQERALRDLINPYESRRETAESLMEHFHMDPATLKRNSVMAEASAAIQMAAASEGVGVGPVHESVGRPSAKEAGSIQFEGTGPIPSVLALLHHLDRVGFPVIIDTIQIAPSGGMPSGLKVTVTLIVLDFDEWKPKEEKSHA